MGLQEFAQEMEQAEEAEASEQQRAEQVEAELLQVHFDVYTFCCVLVFCTSMLQIGRAHV